MASALPVTMLQPLPMLSRALSAGTDDGSQLVPVLPATTLEPPNGAEMLVTLIVGSGGAESTMLWRVDFGSGSTNSACPAAGCSLRPTLLAFSRGTTASRGPAEIDLVASTGTLVTEQ